jgi:hypothetical protein
MTLLRLVILDVETLKNIGKAITWHMAMTFSRPKRRSSTIGGCMAGHLKHLKARQREGRTFVPFLKNPCLCRKKRLPGMEQNTAKLFVSSADIDVIEQRTRSKQLALLFQVGRGLR